MKTLIFNGSPRKNGDTMGLLKFLLAELEGEYKIVDAYRCGIAPCVDCRWCRENDGCCIHDGMDEIYDYIQECDNILIASPVYFTELTGMLLSLLSRLQTYYSARKFRGETPIARPKRGAVILVGGGDGSIDSAAATGRMALRSMNARGKILLASSHATDVRPAVEDAEAVAAVREIAAYFNEAR